jgi:hypothetical protein
VFYAYGYNQYNIDLKFKSIHAEVDAINKLKKSEKPCKINIVVFRVNNSGSELLMAKPCNNCINYIKKELSYKNYKLNKCYYTNENGEYIVCKI